MTTGNSSLTWRRMPFEDARIETVGDDFSSILVVEGVSPYANMRYELNPLVYISRPEYWGIEVIGCLSKIALPAITPFELILVLDFPVGTKGIEVLGPGDKSIKLDYVYTEKTNPDAGARVIVLGERKDLIRSGDDSGKPSGKKK